MDETIKVVVCGAHMSGLPLNTQLTNLGATLVSKTTTSQNYRLYYLDSFTPTRPGMIRVNKEGRGIELEVWEISLSKYGILVSLIPAPLGIGRLELADGTWVQGFLCEGYATESSEDISYHGGWRAFLAHQVSAKDNYLKGCLVG